MANRVPTPRLSRPAPAVTTPAIRRPEPRRGESGADAAFARGEAGATATGCAADGDSAAAAEGGGTEFSPALFNAGIVTVVCCPLSATETSMRKLSLPGADASMTWVPPSTGTGVLQTAASKGTP